jgi:hypothetical protein
MKKTYTLKLPYAEQGEDLATQAQVHNDAEAKVKTCVALSKLALNLQKATKTLCDLAEASLTNSIDIVHAAGHDIRISCEETLGEQLVVRGVLIDLDEHTSYTGTLTFTKLKN